MRQLALPLLLLAGCAPANGTATDDDVEVAESSAGGPVTFQETASWIDWKNDLGTFRVWKECRGPNPGPLYIGHDGSVGPGYVAAVWNKSGELVLDDTEVAAHLGPNSGATGLGMFGFHLARGYAPFTTVDARGGQHVWQIAGRFCNANRRPTDWGGYRGFGVRSFSSPSSGSYQAPEVQGNVGRFAIEVVLGDDHSDLVRVRYTYRIGSNYVKSYVRVTTLCGGGSCDAQAAGGNAFLKEPKLTVGVNPPDPDAVGYAQMNIFSDAGHTATTLDRRNDWSNACGASPGYPANSELCEWGGVNPRNSTGQCNDPARRRVRFWRPGRVCAGDPSCLVVAARAVDTELGTSTPWQGPLGLDGWALANVSDRRQQASKVDSPNGGLEADNCHGGDSSKIAVRRWEMAGYAKTAGCSYENALASFHGWEGGTGFYDCEPLYYRFGASGESWVNVLSYGFGAAPLP
jgi:hypothetical protein